MSKVIATDVPVWLRQKAGAIDWTSEQKTAIALRYINQYACTLPQKTQTFPTEFYYGSVPQNVLDIVNYVDFSQVTVIQRGIIEIALKGIV